MSEIPATIGALLDLIIESYQENEKDSRRGINADTALMLIEMLRFDRPCSESMIKEMMGWTMDKTMHRLRAAKRSGFIIEVEANGRGMYAVQPLLDDHSTPQPTATQYTHYTSDTQLVRPPRLVAIDIIDACNKRLRSVSTVQALARRYDSDLQGILINLLEHGWLGHEHELIEELTFDPPAEIKIGSLYLADRARHTSPRE